MNKKFMKSLITLILIIVIAPMSIVTFAATNIPPATSDFYVNDLAGVFTEDEKTDLMERAVDLSNTYDGIQVVITTITSLDGNTVEDYANAMYNEYGIGKDDMGLLILLSTEDRKVRVEVGKSMESYINDSKAGRFMDKYAIPKLKDNKFNEGLISLQKELIDEIKVCVDKEKVAAEPKAPKEPIVINWGAVGIVVLTITILGILVAIALIIYKKSKKITELEGTIYKLKSKLETVEDNALERIEDANRETREVMRQKQAMGSKYTNLKNDFDTLEDRYRRAKVLYSDIDTKVDAMIAEEILQKDMAKAASVDSGIKQVITLSASKEALPKFEQVLNEYRMLSKKQQSYVKADISKVNSLHQQSMQLKHQHLAGIAIASITAIISGITVGKEKHIKELERAKYIYDQLDSESDKYVERSIPEKISQLLAQARRDKEEREEREEEERRRKRQQEEEEERRRRSYSSSSFDSSSNSGFGGSSGGGGASRGF